MLTRVKRVDCDRCMRAHCVNKNTQIAKQDYSCFQVSGCAICKLHSVCVSSTKDTEVFELSSRLSDSWPIPCCYEKPDCENCFKASHCRNKGLKTFELNLDDPSNPNCFSGYHSVK